MTWQHLGIVTALPAKLAAGLGCRELVLSLLTSFWGDTKVDTCSFLTNEFLATRVEMFGLGAQIHHLGGGSFTLHFGASVDGIFHDYFAWRKDLITQCSACPHIPLEKSLTPLLGSVVLWKSDNSSPSQITQMPGQLCQSR